MHRKKTTLSLVLVLFSILLTNCTTYDFSRRSVQQGNLLPQTQIAKLHTGMSKDNVAILMGTSLLSPTFNNDRWDYAYTWRKGSDPLAIKSVSLYFSHGVLTRIETR
jgi:outer membrane protein assembly factor BamE